MTLYLGLGVAPILLLVSVVKASGGQTSALSDGNLEAAFALVLLGLYLLWRHRRNLAGVMPWLNALQIIQLLLVVLSALTQVGMHVFMM